MIVAAPAAVVPIPIVLRAIGIVIIGLSPVNTIPVFISALVAFFITLGLIMGGKEPEEKQKRVNGVNDIENPHE